VSAHYIAHFRDCGTTGEASRENMARALLPLQDFDLQKATGARWPSSVLIVIQSWSSTEFAPKCSRWLATNQSSTGAFPCLPYRIPIFYRLQSSFPTHHRVNAHLRVGTRDRISQIIHYLEHKCCCNQAHPPVQLKSEKNRADARCSGPRTEPTGEPVLIVKHAP